MNCVMSRPDPASRSTPAAPPSGRASTSESAVCEHELGVGDAEDLEHVVELDLLAAVGDELLERAERVAERAGRRAREHADRGVGRLDALLGGDAAQHAGDLLERRPLEVEAVAAVDDRRRHLVRLGRRQHEDDVRRRLLERLQERVPRRGREHVRLVEDVDAAAAAHRRERDVLAQLADVVDRVVRRGVHLDDVERGAVHDRARGGRLRVEVDARRRRRRSARTPAAWPSTSCRCRASPRTGRRGAPSRARSRCAACGRCAPARRPGRRCAGGGGGRARASEGGS